MIKPSSKVRNGLNFHLRQSQQEYKLSNPNAQFIISAEFDNLNGPLLKHQYPKTIPGFKNIGNDPHCSHLASLMIPNSIENNPGKSDFTVFVLQKNGNVYDLFPSSQTEHNGVDTSFVIKEEDDEEDPACSSIGRINAPNTKRIHQVTKNESPLFFINVVSAVRDSNNERGASIKAIALGTTMVNFLIFKPILAMVLDIYMKSNNDINILIDCFNMVNSLDLSFVKRIHSNSVLQNILNSLNDVEITSKILDPKGKSLPKILRVNELPKYDKFGNEISFKSSFLEYKFTQFKPQILPAYFTRIPLQIDLIKYDRIKVEINYTDHVLKFLSTFIPYLSEISNSNYSWRILINSTNLTKDYLCQFVLALSNLLNCFDEEYFDNSLMMIFPYMELSLLDLLKEWMTQNQRKEKMFFIAGVSNPIFQYHNDIWDFYYDFDTDTLLKSDQIISNNINEVKTERLKSIFIARKSTSLNSHTAPLSPSKNALTLQLISLLIIGQHDNETVLNTFKKASIVQLLKLTNSQPDTKIAEMILKDQYILNYKDFILFPELFDYGTLKLLRLLNELEEGLNDLFWRTATYMSFQGKKKQLQKLYYTLKQLHKFVSMNKRNIGKFINIALNYPLCSMFDGIDISHNNPNGFDIEELVNKKRSEIKSVQSFFISSGDQSTIERFNSHKSLDLLLLPLFLNPYTEEDQQVTIGYLGPPVFHSRIAGTKGKTYFSSVSNLSMISSIYEMNDLMSSDHRFDSNTNDDVATISTVKSNFSDHLSLINKCRQISVKILHRIQRHHIGKLLFELKMNSILKTVYETSKLEFFERRFDSFGPSTNMYEQNFPDRNTKSSNLPYSDSIRSGKSTDIPLSRKNLLNDLIMLGTQFDYQSTLQKKPSLTTTNELLGNLSALKVNDS